MTNTNRRKIKVLIATLLILIMSAFTLSGCTFSEALDNVVELQELREQNAHLTEENTQLKEELATLKFSLEFPDGIVDTDVILNNVNRTVEDLSNGDCLQVTGNAVVVINGGKFNGGHTPLGGAGNTAVWCNSADAKVVINGGEFTIGGLAEGDVGHIDLIYCSAGTIEINGGTFMGEDDTVWLVNCKDANYIDNTASIVIKGGTFVNWNPADNCSEGEHTNFVPEGYIVVSEVINQDKDDEYILYTVVEGEEEPEVSDTPNEF